MRSARRRTPRVRARADARRDPRGRGVDPASGAPSSSIIRVESPIRVPSISITGSVEVPPRSMRARTSCSPRKDGPSLMRNPLVIQRPAGLLVEMRDVEVPEDRVWPLAPKLPWAPPWPCWLWPRRAGRRSVPEITEQPQSVKRGEVVQVVWTGGSPDGAEARVVVERRHGLSWRTEASGGTGQVLLDDEGDGVWSARWQPTYYSPVGHLPDHGRRAHLGRLPRAAVLLRAPEPGEGQVAQRPLPAERDGRVRAGACRGASSRCPSGSRPAGRSCGSCATGTGSAACGCATGPRSRQASRRGKFRGSWSGPRGPRHSFVFELVSLTDGFKNR